MKVLVKLQKLPVYFKLLAVGIILLNLAAVYGQQERKVLQNEMAPLAELISEIDTPLNLENGQLVTAKKVHTKPDFGVGLLAKPKTRNYLYYQKNQLEFSIDGKSSVIPYDKSQSGDLRLAMIGTLNDFLLSSFLITVIQQFFMMLLLVVALVMATLIIAKSKLKAKRIIDVLFLSMIPATLLSLASPLLIHSNLQFIVFAVTLGVLYSLILRKDLDDRVTSYYLGEGVL